MLLSAICTKHDVCGWLCGNLEKLCGKVTNTIVGAQGRVAGLAVHACNKTDESIFVDSSRTGNEQRIAGKRSAELADSSKAKTGKGKRK